MKTDERAMTHNDVLSDGFTPRLNGYALRTELEVTNSVRVQYRV